MKTIDSKVAVVFTTLVLVASTFIGIPLNGGDKGWVFFNFVFRDFISGNSIDSAQPLHILLLIWTCLLYLMPILVFTKYRKPVVKFIPLVYLVLTFFTISIFITLGIPFLIIWIGLMIAVARYDKD